MSLEKLAKLVDAYARLVVRAQAQEKPIPKITLSRPSAGGLSAVQAAYNEIDKTLQSVTQYKQSLDQLNQSMSIIKKGQDEANSKRGLNPAMNKQFDDIINYLEQVKSVYAIVYTNQYIREQGQARQRETQQAKPTVYRFNAPATVNMVEALLSAGMTASENQRPVFQR
jgi:hypothetical protein